jgi:signal transduction histidine kinase
VLRGEFLRLATQSTRQITRMVKGLLDIERLEEGDALLDRKRVALALLITDAVEMVSPTVVDADQELRLGIDPGLPHVQVDPDMIARVIINLIENAAKHTPSGGTIDVRAELVERSARISVADSGPGISPQVINQIFDKYYRVRRPDGPNGVGLGLAFCRLAVEAHGGQIWAECLPDGGTQFSFVLPVDEHEPAVMRPTA